MRGCKFLKVPLLLSGFEAVFISQDAARFVKEYLGQLSEIEQEVEELAAGCVKSKQHFNNCTDLATTFSCLYFTFGSEISLSLKSEGAVMQLGLLILCCSDWTGFSCQGWVGL